MFQHFHKDPTPLTCGIHPKAITQDASVLGDTRSLHCSLVTLQDPKYIIGTTIESKAIIWNALDDRCGLFGFHVAEVCSDAPSERDDPSTHESGQQLLACDSVNM